MGENTKETSCAAVHYLLYMAYETFRRLVQEEEKTHHENLLRAVQTFVFLCQIPSNDCIYFWDKPYLRGERGTSCLQMEL